MKGPDGYEIEGTVEDIYSCDAGVIFDDDGNWQHDGNTNVFWDGQETRVVCGAVVFY